MPLHRRQAPRTLRGYLARAFVSTLALAGGGLALHAVGHTGAADPGARFDGRIVTDQATTRTERMMERYDCSTTGYGTRATPRSAIVRRPAGTLAAVTFDEGWRVYTADGAAILVAVCLRPLP